MALDQGTLDSVNNSNFKIMAEQVSANTASHQQRLHLIAEASVGAILNKLTNLDPTEAAAISTVDQKIAELGSQVAALQQMMKGAMTTPPVTP